MRDDVRDALEEFLVEHVIIGLGNIRGSINRIEATGEAEAETRQVALNRIGAQIDHLESRARSLHGLVCRLEPVERTALRPRQPAPGQVLFQSRRALN